MFSNPKAVVGVICIAAAIFASTTTVPSPNDHNDQSVPGTAETTSKVSGPEDFQRHEVQANSYSFSAQASPSIASHADGSFSVVWHSRRQQAGTYGIYLQRFSSEGQALGSETQVNLFTRNMQTNPAVAADSSGALWVAWESFGQDESFNAIVARRFESEGFIGGDEFLVNQLTAGNQSDVVISTGNNGQVTFHWVTQTADGARKQIVARSFDRSGNPLNAETPISTSDQHQSLPAVAFNNERAVVVWAEQDRFGRPAGIYGRVFDNPISAATPAFLINPNDGQSHIEPAVSLDKKGQINVTWLRSVESEYEVMLRRFDGQGTPRGDGERVSTGGARYVSGASVASTDQGDHVVMWNQQTDLVGRDISIWAQRFDDNGVPVGERFRVNAEANGRHRLAAASGKVRSAFDPNGQDLWTVWYGANANDESSVNLTVIGSPNSKFRFSTPVPAESNMGTELDSAKPHDPPTYDPKTIAADPFGGYVPLGPPGGDFGFTAINATGWNPPDPSLAAGPNHLVAMTNGAIAFFTKTGSLTFTDQIEGAGGFWGGQGATGLVFDPEVLFDPHSNRFFAMANERNPASRSYFLLAVSDDDNPNGSWFKYRIDVTNIADFDIDSPNIGVDEEVVYLAADFFGPDRFLVYMLRKSDLLVGGPISATSLLISGSQSYGLPVMYDADAPAFYMIQAHEFGNFSSVRLHAVTNPLGTPQRTTFNVTVPAYGHPQDPQQQGTSVRPELFEARFWSCVYRNGSLWAVHHHSPNSTGTPRTRWYQFDMNGWPANGSQTPTLVQSGELTPLNAQGQVSSTFFPSIWVDESGNTAITTARSSGSEFISMSRAVRAASDPPGVFQDVQLVRASTSPFTSGSRWGDYSGTTSDPVEPGSFWGIHEFASSNNIWQTHIAKYVVASASTTIVPTIFKVVNGTGVGGTAANLEFSDDLSVDVLAAMVDPITDREIIISLLGNTVDTQFSALTVLVESRVNSPNIIQNVELFNFLTQQFELVSSTAAEQNDTMLTINATGDVSRFVTPGSGSLLARISFESDGPTLFFPWRATIDQFVWQISN